MVFYLLIPSFTISLSVTITLNLSHYLCMSLSLSLTHITVPEEMPTLTAPLDPIDPTDQEPQSPGQDLSHLTDGNLRLVVPDINLHSHVLFNNK